MQPITSSDIIITVDIGGKRFSTLKSTLCNHSSYFAKELVDLKGINSGYILFVDRNPDVFEKVLRILRDLNQRRVSVLRTNDEEEFNSIIEEMSFYSIKVALTKNVTNHSPYSVVSIEGNIQSSWKIDVEITPWEDYHAEPPVNDSDLNISLESDYSLSSDGSDLFDFSPFSPLCSSSSSSSSPLPQSNIVSSSLFDKEEYQSLSAECTPPIEFQNDEDINSDNIEPSGGESGTIIERDTKVESLFDFLTKDLRNKSSTVEDAYASVSDEDYEQQIFLSKKRTSSPFESSDQPPAKAKRGRGRPRKSERGRTMTVKEENKLKKLLREGYIQKRAESLRYNPRIGSDPLIGSTATATVTANIIYRISSQTDSNSSFFSPLLSRDNTTVTFLMNKDSFEKTSLSRDRIKIKFSTKWTIQIPEGLVCLLSLNPNIIKFPNNVFTHMEINPTYITGPYLNKNFEVTWTLFYKKKENNHSVSYGLFKEGIPLFYMKFISSHRHYQQPRNTVTILRGIE